MSLLSTSSTLLIYHSLSHSKSQMSLKTKNTQLAKSTFTIFIGILLFYSHLEIMLLLQINFLLLYIINTQVYIYIILYTSLDVISIIPKKKHIISYFNTQITTFK